MCLSQLLSRYRVDALTPHTPLKSSCSFLCLLRSSSSFFLLLLFFFFSFFHSLFLSSFFRLSSSLFFFSFLLSCFFLSFSLAFLLLLINSISFLVTSFVSLFLSPASSFWLPPVCMSGVAFLLGLSRDGWWWGGTAGWGEMRKRRVCYSILNRRTSALTNYSKQIFIVSGRREYP